MGNYYLFFSLSPCLLVSLSPCPPTSYSLLPIPYSLQILRNKTKGLTFLIPFDPLVFFAILILFAIFAREYSISERGFSQLLG